MDLTAASDDRGQMILVAAIGLALLLTLLAVTLNTAVFAGIHAAETDGGPNAERGAIQYQYSADRAIAGLADRTNREYDTYDTLESELEDAVAAWDGLSRSEYARDGKTTNTSLESVTYESRIVQDEPGVFEDGSEDTAWTVADDVSEVRGFEMDVQKDGLAETSDCTGANACFNLTVEGSGGNSWTLFVYDDGGIKATVKPASGDNETYGPAGTSAELDITDGVFDVDGSGDEFTTFLEDDLETPYTVTYTNADAVDGTYELTVDGKLVEDGETIESDHRYGVNETPRVEARIVAADVGLRYRAADLTYETEIKVVPGETHD